MMLRDVSSRHDPRYIRYWRVRHAGERAGRAALLGVRETMSGIACIALFAIFAAAGCLISML